jgi:hypothetical protein
MTDTVRTLSALQYLLRNGQPAGAITPQDLRDVVVSIPSIARTGRIDALLEFGFGAGGNTATQNTTALQDAFNAAIDGGYEVVLPGGTVSLNPGVRWNNQTPRITGQGKATVLQFTSITDHLLHLGTGTYVDDLGPQGWCRDFVITGPDTATYIKNGSGTKAGLLLNCIKFADIARLDIRHCDVGLDLINNCYGTNFTGLKVGRYDKCNVGIRIRQSTQNGNDHVFHNAWLGGKVACVTIEADVGTGADGIHFVGGQFTGGIGATSDMPDRGCIMLNWSYGTETASGGDQTRLVLSGTSFEAVHRKWCVYAVSPADITCREVALNLLDTSDNAALGFFKNTLPYNDRMALYGTRVQGKVKTAFFGFTPDAGAVPSYYEEGTRGYINHAGADWNCFARGLFDRSGWLRGVAVSGANPAVFMLDGLRLRNNAGTLEKSTDGTSWSAV